MLGNAVISLKVDFAGKYRAGIKLHEVVFLSEDVFDMVKELELVFGDSVPVLEYPEKLFLLSKPWEKGR